MCAYLDMYLPYLCIEIVLHDCAAQLKVTHLNSTVKDIFSYKTEDLQVYVVAIIACSNKFQTLPRSWISS